MSVAQKLFAALLAAVLVLLVGVLGYVTVGDLVAASREVDRTVDVVIRLESVLSELKDAESGQRGFLLTGDSAYLGPYRVARDTLTRELAALRERLTGHPQRLAELDSLSVVVDEKLAEIAETVALQENARPVSAARVVRTNRGRHLMDEARRLVRVMESLENASLRRQEAERAAAATRALWIIGVGTIVAVILLVSINASIRGDLAREQQRRAVERFFNDVDGFLARAPLEYREAMGELARHALPFLADYCGIDVRARDGTIVRAAAAHVDAAKERVLRAMWSRYPFEPDAPYGAPAVLRTGKAEFVPSMSREQVEAFVKDAGHLDMMRTLAPSSYICVPMLSGERVLGVISLVFSDSGRRYDQRMLAHAVEYSRRAATVVERAQLHMEATENANRLGYVARASEILAASLDYEATLSSLARLVVPDLADWCTVSITDDGAPRQIAVAHTDPTKVAWARDLATRYPQDPGARTGVPEVLRTGHSEYYPAITKDMLRAAAVDEEHARLIEQLGFTSAVIVPIAARGRTFGAITLVTAESGKRLTPDDVTLAEELGRRAGIAIDNARLLREAQAARESAQSANKAKSEFLATMSHEIRTPINAVLGYAELLEMELTGPLTGEQRTQLGRIRSSTQHLLGLVNEVLDLAKIESGTLRVESAPAVTGDTVDAVLEMLRPQAEAKQIALSAQCDGQRDAQYVGDEHRVRQVLANLVTNAVKFTDTGGSVSVDCVVVEGPPASVLSDRPYVAMRVRDSGVGIEASQLDSIFQPFVQARGNSRSSYARERSGAGLGLAISRDLARLMGGDITVESTPGEGSLFTLWVPAAAPGVSTAPSAGNEAAARR